jgi:YVTN family beta-propeller protein
MTPRQVGHYRLDGLLGTGGMGEVYKAYDTHRDRYVALKLLPEAFSDDPEYLKRFRRESHVAARLREPHVIPIHDFGEVSGQLFIDMRLVDGSDICTLLDTNGPIGPQRAAYLIGQVAEALDAAHSDNLVHRDIKPSNILVTPSDFVYVVDFGIARSAGGQQTALTITGATIGTLHYMAPERFAGQDVDGRADVYSLACVLYECLTGVPPFSGKDLPALIYAQLYSGPPSASSLVEGIPPALDAVIARGMAKDPQDRFPTAGMLAAAARDALLTEAPTLPPPPPMTELPAPTWTDMPPPRWEAVTSLDAWQDVAEPAVPKAEPAGDHYAADDHFAWGIPDSPTQTVSAASVSDRGSPPPPGNMPPGPSPDPAGGRLPPDAEPGRPAWRRLSVLILAALVIIAVPVALVLIATSKPHTGGTSATQNAGGVDATPTAGAGATGTPASANSGPTLTLPTVAEKITVGQNPSYVAVAPNGKFAYIVNPGAGAITVLNTADDQVSTTIKIPEGPPQSVSFSPDGQTAYVSVYNGSNSIHLVVFIDTATSAVTSVVSVNNHTPGPSTTSPDGRYLYVPNHNMEMSGAGNNVIDVIDTASKKLIREIAVPPNPHWIVFGKNNGRFYATDHMSTYVTVLNASTNSVIGEIEVGETPHGIAISPDGSRLAISSYSGDQVFVVNTATDQEVAQIPVGKEPLEITYSPDGRYIFTVDNLSNTVTVIDAADNRVIGEIKTGKAPTSISVLPNGRQAYVTDDGDGTIEVLNIAQ